MTRPLEIGDIAQRKLDSRLWVLVDIRSYPNDVHTLHFFDTVLEEVVTYTSPFGMRLTDAFLVH